MANNYQGFQFNQPAPAMPLPNAQVPPMQNFQQNTFFPQPVGNVYSLNTATDIVNVPIGPNISVGLCLNENIVHIKSLQNGAPVTLSYKLTSIDGAGTPAFNSPSQEDTVDLSELEKAIHSLDQKMLRFEEEIKKIKAKGGKQEWQI